MNPYISISEISYSYEDTTALEKINLNIQRNELFGVIGPDGAGKTTLFRLLTTLLLPQKGIITYEGKDVVDSYKALRKEIGYMPGQFSLYQDLTVKENLEFFAAVFKTTVQENYYLIKDIYSLLEPFQNRRAGKLSGGMKQKLALSCALIHRPKVLILDEPTTGVDAVSRREFWDMLSNLKSMGITIVVSTPYMDEARRCDRVALIKDGVILKTDTPEAIENQFQHLLFGVSGENNYKILNGLRFHKDIINAYVFGQDIHVEVKQKDALKKVLDELMNKGFSKIDMTEIKPTIEDCFIQQMIHKNKEYENK